METLAVDRAVCECVLACVLREYRMGGYAVASELVDLQCMAGTDIMPLGILYVWHLHARHKAIKSHWGRAGKFRDAR
jgi:hypothetical protein